MATLDDMKMPISSRYPACFDDGHNDARKIVKIAYNLARSRGATRMEFTDNSTKHCSESGFERIRLADFYRLLNGKTWYESILLEAGATYVRMDDPIQRNETIEEDKHRAAEVSWNTMSGNGRIVAPSLPDGFDTSAVGSGRAVLHHLRRQQSLTVCQFLAINLSEFLRNSGITPVYGTRWVCGIGPVLQGGSGRRRTQRRRGVRSAFLNNHGIR
jgi:hypothetical protein